MRTHFLFDESRRKVRFEFDEEEFFVAAILLVSLIEMYAKYGIDTSLLEESLDELQKRSVQ